MSVNRSEALPLRTDPSPLDDLPRLSRAGLRVERRLRGATGLADLFASVAPEAAVRFGPAEVIWRGSGLGRSGVTAQLDWPRQQARVGLGLDGSVAHAIVDGLLGFTRLPADAKRQVTPVEWGVLEFVLARALLRLSDQPGLLGEWDLTIDRVGPDPFDPRDLGPIVTIRWPVRVGEVAGSARLWLPATLLGRIDDTPPRPYLPRPGLDALASTWRAEAGTLTLPRGLSRLRAGAVVPLGTASLHGTVADPRGPIRLTCRDADGRSWFDVEPTPGSSASRLALTSPLRRDPTPSEPDAMPTTPPASPTEIPVTLVVELGRVNLTLARLADLKPGDVVELNRHSREPVELTSNGRLVARGELVQIDAELGVRVTSLLL